MSETTIALALLKANWDEYHKSYLDNFNLLTAECLRQSTHAVASAEQLVHDLTKDSLRPRRPPSHRGGSSQTGQQDRTTY